MSNEYIVEDFLKINTDLLELGAPKKGKFGGKYVAIKYKGLPLYVKYDSRRCPFGINTNRFNEKVTGYDLSISLKYNDEYYEKADDLDYFFTRKCLENHKEWGCSEWNSLLKYSTKKDSDGVILDYPPRLNFSIIANKGSLSTQFFSFSSNPIPNVTPTNMDIILPKGSNVKILANWSYLHISSKLVSMKPKATQVKVYPIFNFEPGKCLLEEDNEHPFYVM